MSLYWKGTPFPHLVGGVKKHGREKGKKRGGGGKEESHFCERETTEKRKWSMNLIENWTRRRGNIAVVEKADC